MHTFMIVQQFYIETALLSNLELGNDPQLRLNGVLSLQKMCFWCYE